MALLKNARWERFAQERAKGVGRDIAYALAGFGKSKDGAVQLGRRPEVLTRISELIDQRYRIDDEATKTSLARAEVAKLDIVLELKAIGFARMDHFVSFDNDGRPKLDYDKMAAHSESWAAVEELTIEEYVEGTGENAKEVVRTRVKLKDKRGALIDLARMHGMVDSAKVNVGVAVQIVMTEDELRA